MREIRAIIWKDLLLEWRAPEGLVSLGGFCLATLLAFHFALGPDPARMREAGSGVLWATYMLAGVAGAGRTFASEERDGCMEGLLSAPVDRGNIYLGKFLVGTLRMLVVEALTLPPFAALYGLPLGGGKLLQLGAVLISGTVGLVAVGTLFSGLTLRTRAREALLPVLTFPIVVPVVIGAVEASRSVFSGDWDEVDRWFKLLISFDVTFVSLAWLVFGYAVEE